MHNLLIGKKAIVTGGTRGIGRAIAEAYLDNGASVVIWGTNIELGNKVVSELNQKAKNGSKVYFNKVDVSNFEEVKGGVELALKELGEINILVNNAGITKDALLMKMGEKEWSDVISVNLNSVYYTCASVIRHMIKAKSGKIINISSVVGISGSPGQTNYAAAKAGMIGFTKSLSKEVGGRNINVNCIAPGFIETDMTANLKQEVVAEWIKKIPLKRSGNVSDIAGAAVFLGSNLSEYVTGQVLVVDGGMI